MPPQPEPALKAFVTWLVFELRTLPPQRPATVLGEIRAVFFAESWICKETGKEKTLVRIVAHLLSGSLASLRAECTWA